MEDSRHEASFIRSVMIQKKEALGLIKRKMIQLEEEAKAIEGDLIRFAAAHLPHMYLVATESCYCLYFGTKSVSRVCLFTT
jgi:hypothetical protein